MHAFMILTFVHTLTHTCIHTTAAQHAKQDPWYGYRTWKLAQSERIGKHGAELHAHAGVLF
jgi:hypothetical protein